jgi:hypothetical protein
VRGSSRTPDQHVVGEAKVNRLLHNPRPRSHPPHATLACDYLPEQLRIKERLTESCSAKQAAWYWKEGAGGSGAARPGRG